MKIKHFIPMLSLQIFAEGAGTAGGAGDGGTAQGQGVTEAAALPQTKGAKNNPLANVKYGIQDAAPVAEVQKTTEQPDLDAEFEQLIKGKFKGQYDARMQDTIRNRLKGSKETAEKLSAVSPILEMLGKKYGVDAKDIEALNKAIQDDDSYFEEEALERGISVQQLKEIRKMERENAELSRQLQEQQTKEKADRLHATWLKQEEATKLVYPTFNMEAELQNPDFVNLITNNVNVRTAYEVLHKDDIIPAAMQFAAQAVEQKFTNKIIANGARPTENGMSSQGAAVVKSDVSQLSKADRAEIIRRVQRGEKIRF